MTAEFVFDHARARRTGIEEAVLCPGKSVDQIAAILTDLEKRSGRVLLTRMSASQADELGRRFDLDFDEQSRTAYFGEMAPGPPDSEAQIAVLSAGTSDIPVAREAERTLRYYGLPVKTFFDIGVAGLWRLGSHIAELDRYRALIVVAGMDGALPSVVGGLLGGLVIAVPTSTGYGTARGGETALHAALSSCAPGIVVVNIDNGYGAAIAALRAFWRNGNEPERNT